MECSTDDEASGYLHHGCWTYIRAAIEQMTNAGLWVVVTARVKYAAGYTWPNDPDVFHDDELKRRFYVMWRWVARQLNDVDNIAGYEIMSEPRTRSVSQRDVMAVMAGGCDAVYEEDPLALCIVGPAPYYKMWTLEDDIDSMALPGRDRDNIVYTFDFFVPKAFVMSNTGSAVAKGEEPASFPDEYRCKDVYDTWWRGRCDGWDDYITIDVAWLRQVMQIPVRLRERVRAPVFCNQWGVKDEVWQTNGRLTYANALLDIFATNGIHSTYWTWRSYAKGDRDVREPEWGFELVHNPGSASGQAERIEVGMTNTLQNGFAKINRYPIPRCIDDPMNHHNPEAVAKTESWRCRFTNGLYPPPPRQPSPPTNPPASCNLALGLNNVRNLEPPLWCFDLRRAHGSCLRWYATEPDGKLHRCELSSDPHGYCSKGADLVCMPPPQRPPFPPPSLAPSMPPDSPPAPTPLAPSHPNVPPPTLPWATAAGRSSVVAVAVGAGSGALVIVILRLICLKASSTRSPARPRPAAVQAAGKAYNGTRSRRKRKATTATSIAGPSRQSVDSARAGRILSADDASRKARDGLLAAASHLWKAHEPVQLERAGARRAESGAVSGGVRGPGGARRSCWQMPIERPIEPSVAATKPRRERQGGRKYAPLSVSEV